MMSPLKLSVIVCGAAAGLAVAPYVVKQILPPVTESAGTAESTSSVVATDIEAVAKLDLPIAGPNTTPSTPAALALAAPVKEETPTRPELHLPAPALPSPAPEQQELALPSLSNQSLASAMPSPAAAATPTPPPTPAPTPEIPYRADVETAQNLMKKLGIDTGKIDGKLGPNTQAAVRDFQKKHGLSVTGEVTSELLTSMEKAVAALPTPTPEPKVVITEANEKKADESKAESVGAELESLIVRKSDKDKKSTEEKKEVAAAKPKPAIDPGPVPTLQNRKDVRKLQEQLKEAGTYTGKVDGKWGDLTRAAMREFQEKNGLEVTGRPNKETWLAMHSDSPAVPEQEEADSAVADKSSSDVDTMEISSAKSVPSLSADEPEEYVVTVNGDGVSNPSTKSPLPTPATVSSFDDDGSSDKASEDEVASKPTVQVSTPEREKNSSKDLDNEEPVDLAVAEVDEDAEAERLRKEIESAKARIQSVSNDSTYEVKKYAPKMLETVNSMADKLKTDSLEDDPAGTKAVLRRIDEELEKAKTESRKKKAENLVSGVRKSYKDLKANFDERIKALSLKDEEEKSQREELTMLVANVDLGFEAMEKDFKAGKFDPIFKNAEEFQFTIDQINIELAKLYVTAKLDEKDVKRKLDKDETKEIETLIEKDDHLKAAEVLEKVVSSASKKKS